MKLQFISLSYHGKGSTRWKKVVHSTFVTTLQCIWKSRNAATFEAKAASTQQIMEEIKVLGFLWVKNRVKFNYLTWSQWCIFELSSLGV
ncbi:hypothetical protein R6Q57_021678 [Mikania cordata]